MRKISGLAIFCFSLFVTLVLCEAIGTTALIAHAVPEGDFRGILLLFLGFLLTYAYYLAMFRLVMKCFPLLPGEIEPGSQQQFIYDFYLLCHLLMTRPLVAHSFIPVPLLRPIYQMLGAKLGTNTYSSGYIMDPLFVEAGNNCIIGEGSLVVSHVIENSRLAFYPVKMGDRVTIGARAILLAGVDIGNDAIIAAGAIVPKGTKIGSGETWGGVPARKIQSGTRHQLSMPDSETNYAVIETMQQPELSSSNS